MVDPVFKLKAGCLFELNGGRNRMKSHTERLTYVKTMRRTLHKIPELGHAEYKTSAFIKSQLDQMGIRYESVLETGIVAFIEGTRPQKTLAFRADMDALPIGEETGESFESEHPGMMHACGHDGHMAMLLGLAKYLSDPEVSVMNHIVLIFQPAEEGPGGADPLIQAGIFETYKIDEIYGIHVYPELAQGKVSSCPGPMMAMVGEFDLKLIAKSAHGAMPNMGLDAVLIASEMVLGLQSIVSRNIDPIEPAVLTVGKFTSGERRNILAGTANLEGTIRAYNQDVFQVIINRIKTYVQGVAAAYAIEYELEIRDLYPPVVNDVNLYETFKMVNGDLATIQKPQMISEDFSYYQKKVPGLFYFLGVRNEEKGFVYPLHHPKFNLDEQALMDGVESYIRLLKYTNSIKDER